MPIPTGILLEIGKPATGACCKSMKSSVEENCRTRDDVARIAERTSIRMLLLLTSLQNIGSDRIGPLLVYRVTDIAGACSSGTPFVDLASTARLASIATAVEAWAPTDSLNTRDAIVVAWFAHPSVMTARHEALWLPPNQRNTKAAVAPKRKIEASRFTTVA